MRKAALAFLILAVPFSLRGQPSGRLAAASGGSSSGGRTNAGPASMAIAPANSARSDDSSSLSAQNGGGSSPEVLRASNEGVPGSSASAPSSADGSALPAAPSPSGAPQQPGQDRWKWFRRPKHEQPVVSTAFGFNYIRTNVFQNKVASPSTDRLGWYGSEQWNPWTNGGFRFEGGSAQSYHKGQYAHGQSYVLGPALALPYHYQPMIYVGGGSTRESIHTSANASLVSSNGALIQTQVVNWNTTLVGGVGVIARFTRRVGVQFLPEYIAIHQPNGDWTGAISAKVGIVFNGYGNR